MTIALIAEAGGATSTTSATTSAIDSTGADLLILGVADFYGSPSLTSHVSDSKGNTYVKIGETDTSGYSVSIFACFNPIVGAGHTATYSTGGATYPSAHLSAWSGAISIPGRYIGAGSASATSQQPGSLTPISDNHCILSYLFNGAVQTYSINGGFTKMTGVAYNAGVSVGLEAAYLIQTTAAAANPTWSCGSATQLVTGQTPIPPQGGGGGSVFVGGHSSRIIGG